MLDSEFPALSRPVPPAKARRSASASAVSRNTPSPPHDWRSPPPYASVEGDVYAAGTAGTLLPTLLGSPITATSRLVGLDDSSTFATSADNDWIQERSREELEELLQRAGVIIREREEELKLTSETCRNLSETSAFVRTKSDVLVSQLSTSVRSSSPNQSISRQMYDADTAVSPPLSSVVWSSQRSCSPHSQSPNPRLRERSRHILTSAEEISTLADQNAELLSKLADLEADAARAERAGKRRLQHLEHEIQGLRSELEMTRATSVRLEESIQSASNLSGLPPGLDEQLVRMWKKLERGARVRELKAKMRPRDREDLEASLEKRDFAPSSSSSPRPTRVRLNSMHNPRTNDSDVFQEDGSSADGTTVPSELLSVRDALVGSVREQAIVSLLLLKIHELEEINTTLSTEHAATRLRLDRVQEETDEARRLYDLFDDNLELEMELVSDSADVSDIDAKLHNNVKPADCESETPSRGRRVRLRPFHRKPSLSIVERSQVTGVPAPNKSRRFSSMDDLESIMNQCHPSASPQDGAHQLKGLQESSSLEPHEDDPTIPISSRHARRISNRHGFGLSLPPAFSPFDEVDESSNLVALHVDTVNSPTEAEGDATTDSDNNDNELRWFGGDTSVRSLQCELGNALALDSQNLRPPQHARSHSIAELLTGDAVEGEDVKEVGENLTFPLDEHIRQPTLRRSRGNIARAARSQRNKDSSELDELVLPGALTPYPVEIATMSPPDPTERRHRFTAPIIEIWLWLQFAVVVVVFVFTMARMGPKSVLQQPASYKSKAI